MFNIRPLRRFFFSWRYTQEKQINLNHIVSIEMISKFGDIRVYKVTLLRGEVYIDESDLQDLYMEIEGTEE